MGTFVLWQMLSSVAANLVLNLDATSTILTFEGPASTVFSWPSLPPSFSSLVLAGYHGPAGSSRVRVPNCGGRCNVACGESKGAADE